MVNNDNTSSHFIPKPHKQLHLQSKRTETLFLAVVVKHRYPSKANKPQQSNQAQTPPCRLIEKRTNNKAKPTSLEQRRAQGGMRWVHQKLLRLCESRSCEQSGLGRAIDKARLGQQNENNLE